MVSTMIENVMVMAVIAQKISATPILVDESMNS